MKKKEMIPSAYKENKSYREKKLCYIYKKGFSTYAGNKKIIKSEIVVIIMENIEELLTVHVI